MSEIKLLPCPFCGGEANVYDDEYNHYAIGCKLCCDVTPITTWEDTVEKASTIWNTRKTAERIVERLAEFLETYSICEHCKYDSNHSCTLQNPCVHAFAQAMALKWLQEEAKGDSE